MNTFITHKDVCYLSLDINLKLHLYFKGFEFLQGFKNAFKFNSKDIPLFNNSFESKHFNYSIKRKNKNAY